MWLNIKVFLPGRKDIALFNRLPDSTNIGRKMSLDFEYEPRLRVRHSLRDRAAHPETY